MVESRSTFYNWGMTLLIISLVAILAGSFIDESAQNYQKFTNETSPSFYVKEITNLSVMDDMVQISRDAHVVLNGSQSQPVGFLGEVVENVPFLVDVSDFGIILFKTVGSAFRILFKIFTLPVLILPLIWNAFPGVPDIVKTFVLAGISLTLVFMLIRVVTKKDKI